MNEDEDGITPPDVTAMTIQPARSGPGWWVIIEQGNGDMIKDIELTPMEGTQLGCMLTAYGTTGPLHVEFVDVTRRDH